MTEFILEEEYFGESIGNVTLHQLPFPLFQQQCKTKNNGDEVETISHESTVLRLYSGAHVAVRLLIHLSSLVEYRSVVELGCGVGAMSLVGLQHANFKKVVL